MQDSKLESPQEERDSTGTRGLPRPGEGNRMEAAGWGQSAHLWLKADLTSWEHSKSGEGRRRGREIREPLLQICGLAA